MPCRKPRPDRRYRTEVGVAFLPEDFEVPILHETDVFRIRPITIHDLVKDYDAVMTNREHLWALFGEAWGWPEEDLTIEQDLVDPGWHQEGLQMRSSFDYAVAYPRKCKPPRPALPRPNRRRSSRVAAGAIVARRECTRASPYCPLRGF